MDLRTGRTYETREAALADGVPASDLAEVVQPKTLSERLRDAPIVRFSSGPFKRRTYKRHPDTGQLVRVFRQGERR